MLTIIKEIGIFIVIAQAVLYFVPQEVYAKYVKVLIGIMIIAKLASPVFLLLRGEAWENIVLQGEQLSEQFVEQQNMDMEEDSYDNLLQHYSKMAEEQGERVQQEEMTDE